MDKHHRSSWKIYRHAGIAGAKVKVATWRNIMDNIVMLPKRPSLQHGKINSGRNFGKTAISRVPQNELCWCNFSSASVFVEKYFREWPVDRRENAERVHRENAEQVNCTKPCLADFCFLPPSPATANGWANVRFKIDIGRFPATCSRPLPLQPLSTASSMCWSCLGLILTLPTFGSYSDTSLHVVKPGQWSLSWTLLSTKCTLCLKILQLGDLSEAISSNESTQSSKSSSKNHLAEFPSSSFGTCFSCLAVLSHNFSEKTDTNTERERITNTE